MKKISQYCQSCRAANEPGEASCQQCGTPLMIVVYPPGMRHDQFAPSSHYEDHLLERISLLEMRLLQLSDSLSLTLQVINDQSKIINDEHDLVRGMFELIKNLGSEEARKLKPQWDELIHKHELKNISPRINDIMAAGDCKNPEMLELLVREAFDFIAEKDEARTIAALKRAEPIAPKNVPLLVLFAEQLFYADKFEKAKGKLEKAFDLAPENEQVRFLLGAIYADEHEIEKAGKMLAFSTENEKISCIVQIISGMAAAFKNDWEKSAEHFEKSLEKYEFPESLYLSGCAFFQMSEYEISLEHLEKAVEIDSEFTDALFMQSLVLGLLDRSEEADEAAQTAVKNIENGARCMEFFGNKKMPDLQNALPFLHFETKKRLLTGGAQRIRKFFRSFTFHILND